MQAKVKTIKTVSNSDVKEFDNDVNDLIKAGWQIMGPPIVFADDKFIYYVQQLAQLEILNSPLMP